MKPNGGTSAGTCGDLISRVSRTHMATSWYSSSSIFRTSLCRSIKAIWRSPISPAAGDQPGVAARIADRQTGLFVPFQELTEPRLSLLLDQVLNDSTYRDNARKLEKAIAEANGLSVAADLIEESLGVPKKAGKA